MKLMFMDVWNALVAYRNAYGRNAEGIWMRPEDLRDLEEQCNKQYFHMVRDSRDPMPIQLYGIPITLCDWQAPGMLTLIPINGDRP